MPPPWVLFDSAASYGGNCNGSAEPDIAGVGVVISFVLASIMTTTASILAMILDQAFDSKGRFSLRRPVTYFRDHFLDTEWKKDYAWRPFLDPLIIGLGDQQLITGYAVLLSGWIKVSQHTFALQGAHFVLILYICALSSSSHLAALITLRKYLYKYKLIARIRITLVITFALFLLASMIAAIVRPTMVVAHDNKLAETQRDRVRRLSFVLPMFFIFLGFSTALVCVLHHPQHTIPGLAKERSSDSSSANSILGLVTRKIADSNPPQTTVPSNLGLRVLYYLFLNPLIAFIVQIILAVLSVILVLSQKFARPTDETKWCGLQDSGENTWGFGQTLSVVMLLLPALSAAQTYLEGRHDIQEG
ncbi:uncharacterized protein BDR25DRAFT_234056 [Lindgomyces ingoldianus]|uniref:Uncharacterized protein n=1 Tax=Lindgomyces ingoldianus TaxID=673940 RepID=A0ACB6QL52_9PLEO|nr:uncharacterized protein BDR25DRAFT_234056 [Lindgomyces ingoldianus]KAF2467673.1 hypothetical protein BDR25DRAFT_234056 [Lindgomyces ingoldianus]